MPIQFQKFRPKKVSIGDVPPIGWTLAQRSAALQPFSLVDRGAMVKNEHLRGMEPARKSSPPPVKSALERRIMPRFNLEKGVVAAFVTGEFYVYSLGVVR